MYTASDLTDEDYNVNRLLYVIYECVMNKKIMPSIVAKNALEYDMIFGTVRIERNKQGFTVYCTCPIGSYEHNIKLSNYVHVVEFLYIDAFAMN